MVNTPYLSGGIIPPSDNFLCAEDSIFSRKDVYVMSHTQNKKATFLGQSYNRQPHCPRSVRCGCQLLPENQRVLGICSPIHRKAAVSAHVYRVWTGEGNSGTAYAG